MTADARRRRLLSMACMRLAGWTWRRIAEYHGYRHHQSAQQWCARALRAVDP